MPLCPPFLLVHPPFDRDANTVLNALGLSSALVDFDDLRIEPVRQELQLSFVLFTHPGDKFLWHFAGQRTQQFGPRDSLEDVTLKVFQRPLQMYERNDRVHLTECQCWVLALAKVLDRKSFCEIAIKCMNQAFQAHPERSDMKKALFRSVAYLCFYPLPGAGLSFEAYSAIARTDIVDQFVEQMQNLIQLGSEVLGSDVNAAAGVTPAGKRLRQA